MCGWAEDIKDGYEVNMTEVRELVDEMYVLRRRVKVG